MPESAIARNCQRPHAGSQPSHPTELTTAARAQIPNGPTNLTVYIHRYESHEHVTMSQETHRCQTTMARMLKRWEADWQAVSGEKT